MTKDIIITVRGLQTAEDGAIETVSPGAYYFKNGKHYIFYEEVMEGVQEKTKNTIKLSDGCMELTKKGSYSIHMLFEKDRKIVTYYNTPFGNLAMGIHAYRVDVKETDDQIGIEVEYALDINHEHLSDCRINIRIQPRSADFKLIG